MAALLFLVEMAKPDKRSKETHNYFPLWQQSSGKRQLFLAVAAIAIGVAGAHGAIGFLLLIDAIQLLVYGAPSETVYQRARELEWWHRLVTPALGGVIIGIFIHYFLRDRRPHGVADVMQATISSDGNIGLSSVLIKETTLENALNLFETSGLSCLPVVEPAESMRLVGVLYYKDALLTYNHTMIAVNQQA